MIEPETGEILCMVSSPTYDPSLLVGRIRGKNYMELQKNPYKPLFNRSIMAQYPPGSTFKPTQGLIFLQEGVINAETRFTCAHGYTYRGGKPACHGHPSPLPLVGALYAIGYSPNEIDSLVALQDWQLLLSDKVKRDNLTFPEKENSEKYVITLPFGFDKKDRMIDGMVKGQSLQNLFSNLTIGYHDSVDFRSFPIPFSCVAVNIVDGKDYVFQKGSLPVAMRASMAIPAVFTPVKLDSMVLVDGGLNNNYPADVAKEMGADIIIGVDLGSSDLKERQNLNSSVGIVSQIVALHGYEKYQRNLKVTDLLIRPDLHPYNSTSFTASAIDTMIIRGEEATRKAWPTLMELKKEIGITDSVVPISKRIHLSNRANSFLIRNIHFEGADPHDEKWLLKICKLKENSYITLEQLHHAMAVLVETNAYSNVSYKLIGEESKDLYLIVAPKSASSITSLKSLEPTS